MLRLWYPLLMLLLFCVGYLVSGIEVGQHEGHLAYYAMCTGTRWDFTCFPTYVVMMLHGPSECAAHGLCVCNVVDAIRSPSFSVLDDKVKFMGGCISARRGQLVFA